MSSLSPRVATPKPAARARTLGASSARAGTTVRPWLAAALGLATALAAQGRLFQPLGDAAIATRLASPSARPREAPERSVGGVDDSAAQSLHRIGVALVADVLARSAVSSATTRGPAPSLVAFWAYRVR